MQRTKQCAFTCAMPLKRDGKWRSAQSHGGFNLPEIIKWAEGVLADHSKDVAYPPTIHITNNYASQDGNEAAYTTCVLVRQDNGYWVVQTKQGPDGSPM